MKLRFSDLKDVWLSISIAGVLVIGATILVPSVPLGFTLTGIISWLGGGIFYAIAKHQQEKRSYPSVKEERE